MESLNFFWYEESEVISETGSKFGRERLLISLADMKDRHGRFSCWWATQVGVQRITLGNDKLMLVRHVYHPMIGTDNDTCLFREYLGKVAKSFAQGE
jgi:hypothetical protein